MGHWKRHFLVSQRSGWPAHRVVIGTGVPCTQWDKKGKTLSRAEAEESGIVCVPAAFSAIALLGSLCVCDQTQGELKTFQIDRSLETIQALVYRVCADHLHVPPNTCTYEVGSTAGTGYALYGEFNLFT